MDRFVPSTILMAAVASSLKLTCPGVSIIFIRYDFERISFSNSETGIDLTETPLSCSTSNVSV